jgi:hypothetical protein
MGKKAREQLKKKDNTGVEETHDQLANSFMAGTLDDKYENNVTEIEQERYQ